MSRYIDADKLLVRFSDLITAYNTAGTKRCDFAAEVLKDAVDIIRAEPITDVSPVVHGHWIDHVYKMDYGGDVHMTVCSNCSNDIDFWLTHGYILRDEKYCPNCGAKILHNDFMEECKC